MQLWEIFFQVIFRAKDLDSPSTPLAIEAKIGVVSVACHDRLKDVKAGGRSERGGHSPTIVRSKGGERGSEESERRRLRPSTCARVGQSIVWWRGLGYQLVMEAACTVADAGGGAVTLLGLHYRPHGVGEVVGPKLRAVQIDDSNVGCSESLFIPPT